MKRIPGGGSTGDPFHIYKLRDIGIRLLIKSKSALSFLKAPLLYGLYNSTILN